VAIYLVSGKLGSGKTLACVGQIREAIFAGRRVATNLDLELAELVGPRNRTARVVRLPDKPCVDDLAILGSGNDSPDENQNGVLVLDELASWINARTFNDKARAPVLDWLIHSRKYGWDVFFVCQNIAQVDKQLRESLVEYLVVCRRLDRLKIPLIGGLIRGLTAGTCKGMLPKIHVAVVRYGVDQQAPIADRWVYRARDLYRAYDTRQVFSDRYDTGPYSLLPPAYFDRSPSKSFFQRLLDQVFKPVSRPPLKPKLPILQQLSGLDPEEAMVRWHQLQAQGLL